MWRFNFGNNEDAGQAHQAGPPRECGMRKFGTDSHAFWRNDRTGKYEAIPEGYTLPPMEFPAGFVAQEDMQSFNV
jgi:hypothetical protein